MKKKLHLAGMEVLYERMEASIEDKHPHTPPKQAVRVESD